MPTRGPLGGGSDDGCALEDSAHCCACRGFLAPSNDTNEEQEALSSTSGWALRILPMASMGEQRADGSRSSSDHAVPIQCCNGRVLSGKDYAWNPFL
jgi:hypothetical protein